jgi:signal transduction histidine kinase
MDRVDLRYRLDLHDRFSVGGLRDLSSSLARQSLLVAAVCLLADVGGFLSRGPLSVLRPQDWAVLVVVVAVDAALALPARFSGWVALAQAVVVLAGAGLLGGSTVAGQGNEAGALIAGYRAGAWLRGVPAWLALAVMVLGIGGSQAIFGTHDSDVIPIRVLKNAVLPWLVGRYTTARRAYIAELEQRAETHRRDGEIAVQHAVAEERSAIARDLHDVISHHVSAIGVHAGAARMGLPGGGRSERVADSLSAVETSSRAAMLDLRRLLDLLHGDRADMDRQPGLDNLEELLDGVRRAGLPTRLSTHGVARALPGSLDIALYRIIQELLTNALRHGDGSGVEIQLHYAPASVSVVARNGIPSTAPPAASDVEEYAGAGRGLAGIRKRAALFDGAVAHGPEPDGRCWKTAVTFPLGAQQ